MSSCLRSSTILNATYVLIWFEILQDEYTALMIAAERGHHEIVDQLIKAKANVDLQNKVRALIILVVTTFR